MIEHLLADPQIKGTPATKTTTGGYGIRWTQMEIILNTLGWRPVANAISFKQAVADGRVYCFADKHGKQDNPINVNGRPCCPQCHRELVRWRRYTRSIPQ